MAETTTDSPAAVDRGSRIAQAPPPDDRDCRSQDSDRPDGPAILEETASYLRDFNRLEAVTGTPKELCAAMLQIYPRRVNPGSLWVGAKKAKA